MKHRISGEYNWKPTPEQFAALLRYDSKVELYAPDDKYEHNRCTLKTNIHADPNDLLTDPDLKGVVFRIVASDFDCDLYVDLNARLRAIEQRLSAYTPPKSAEEHAPQFNAKCHVHVPGLGLLKIDEVSVLEDGCTNELSRWLSDGWQILAVCPQPNQRRPDYILGRTKE